MAPSPTFTGATSAVSEPMKAPAPISVQCLVEAVIIAGDGARADIGAGAHARIAQIGEMIGLGALLDRARSSLPRNCRYGRLRRSRAPGRSRAKGPMMAPDGDVRAFQMANGCGCRAPLCTVTPGPNTTKGSISTSALQHRVMGEEHRLRRGHADAVGQQRARAAAPAFAVRPAPVRRGC